MAAPTMRPLSRPLAVVTAIGFAAFLAHWMRSSALSISSFPGTEKAKQVASGPLWRRWHIALEDRQAAEQLIKNYELWADAEHWYPKTDRKYGVLRQWVSFIDATKTPPHYVTQWGDVREDRRGLRLLHLSVRNEYVFDDNSPELGLSTHPKGRYDCYITLELHP